MKEGVFGAYGVLMAYSKMRGDRSILIVRIHKEKQILFRFGSRAKQIIYWEIKAIIYLSPPPPPPPCIEYMVRPSDRKSLREPIKN